MQNRRTFLASASAFIITGGIARQASANKTATEIEAPACAKKGEEIIIKLKFKHDGNSFAHYTDWAYVKVNGKEIKRWEYSAFNRPESEVFTREVKYVANGKLEIEAEAHCNNHGSAGIAKKEVCVA